jgi:hypothetical protein
MHGAGMVARFQILVWCWIDEHSSAGRVAGFQKILSEHSDICLFVFLSGNFGFMWEWRGIPKINICVSSPHRGMLT